MTELYSALKSLWTLWVMGIFVAIAVWAYWPRNRQRFEAHARIPLDDDERTQSVRLEPSLRLGDAPTNNAKL